MNNRQRNNNRRNAQARALPIVNVPNGLSDQALLTSYQQQYANRLAFGAPAGMYNVHADDALRRNVAEVLFSDGRRLRSLATRVSGQAYLVSPSTRQIAGLGHIAHVLAPTIMAEDADRDRAVNDAIRRGDLMEIGVWLNGAADPRQTTVCRHTLQACDCHVARGDVGSNAFFYAGVDVIPHVSPADVHAVVSRPGCSGFVTAQRVFDDDCTVVERNGVNMIRTEVPGTGAFEEHDYRGFERGGLWLFAEPDGYVITGVCEMSPDGVGIVAYIQATKLVAGRAIGRLGHDEPVEKFETGTEAITVYSRGGHDRTLVVAVDDRRVTIRTTDEALRLARNVSMPSAKTSIINAVNTLKLTLKTAGVRVSDADANVLYVYGVTHASHGAIPAHALLNATLGYSVLPEAVSAHLLAPNIDRELGDIIDRLMRLRATNAEHLRGTGPTATAAASAAAGLSCFAAMRRSNGAAFALAAISVIAGAQANWRQFAADVQVLLKRYAATAVGLLALGALALVPRQPLSWFRAFADEAGQEKLDALAERACDIVSHYAGAWLPRARVWLAAKLRGCVEWLAPDEELSVFAGRGNWALDVFVAPVLEEYVKRKFDWPAAAGAAYGVVEGVMLREPPQVIAVRSAAHAALGAMPLPIAIQAHVAINALLCSRPANASGEARVAAFIWIAAITAFYGLAASHRGTREELATVAQDGRYRIGGKCLDECSRNDIRSGVPTAAVCHVRDIGAIAPPLVGGNVLSCRYTPPPPCDMRQGGWYCGGVRGYDICYDAQCAHNAYAGAVKRVMLPRPADCRGAAIVDDERVIANNFAQLLNTPAVLFDRDDAVEVSKQQVDFRDDYIASLSTPVLRREAADVLDITAQFPGVHLAKSGMKYLVKVEKVLLSSPQMRDDGDTRKTARAIIPPQTHGKSLNSYNHGAEAAFFARTKVRDEWPLYKYEGTAEDAARIYDAALQWAHAELAAGNFPAGGELRILRVDVKKCDASQGPAAAAFHRVQLQHLGVIDDTPPIASVRPDATDDCYRIMAPNYVARPTVDVLIRERTECQLAFVRPHIVYDEHFRFATAGKLPSGVGYTSGATTRMVSAIQSTALATAYHAIGADATLAAHTLRCVRGDDNFAIVCVPGAQAQQFEDAITATFAQFGMATELELAPLHDGRPLAALCSHLMYPATPLEGEAAHLPAPRIGRVLTRLLTLRAAVPRKQVRSAVYAAGVDLLHNCGHVRLLRLLGQRIIATCGSDKAFRTYDRDDIYRMTAAGDAILRADDDACDDFVAQYYAYKSGLCVGAVAAQYDYACLRMVAWSYGEVFDGEFEQLAARVDSQ